jgi:hypothetical protein
LQLWDGEHHAPTSIFASPNTYHGMTNHLMGLMAPSIPEFMPENADAAKTPLPLAAGQSVSLASSLRLTRDAGGARGVAAAVRGHVASHGLAPLPDLPRSFEDAAHLCARAVRDAWHADARGWEHTNTGPVNFDPQIAAFAVRYLAMFPDSPYAGELREQLDQALEGRETSGYAPLGFLIGNPLLVADASLDRSRHLAATAEGEGLWVFRPDERTEGLGEAGATEVGLIAEPTSHLLQSARTFGDPVGSRVGRAGVDRLNGLSDVPAGGETWEVPLHAPNLRAAAMAVESNVDAYRLTGNAEHLEQARHWASSGLPFIYQWQAPHREIMPYAAISVFGATFYTNLWFGNAVQWVGLVYADALRELAQVDDSFPWLEVARGITISGMHQQKTEADPCGHVGYYPDSYSPVRGEETYHWCLEPHLLAANILAELGAPLRPRTVRTEIDGKTLLVSSLAEAQVEPGVLAFRLGPVPETTVAALVSFVSRPDAVLADGAVLPEDPSMGAETGWAWDGATGRLAVRAPSGAHVEIVGAEVIDSPAEPAADLVNGDFANGLLGWTPEPADRVQVAQENGVSFARLISGDGVPQAQLTSRTVTVDDAATYELAARVRMPQGEGDYKVTIHWLDGWSAHIAYDNDWTGTDQPRAWATHGGTFTPPPGARRARVILGVRGGATAEFDEIALEPVDG